MCQLQLVIAANKEYTRIIEPVRLELKALVCNQDLIIACSRAVGFSTVLYKSYASGVEILLKNQRPEADFLAFV